MLVKVPTWEGFLSEAKFWSERVRSLCVYRGNFKKKVPDPDGGPPAVVFFQIYAFEVPGVMIYFLHVLKTGWEDVLKMEERGGELESFKRSVKELQQRRDRELEELGVTIRDGLPMVPELGNFMVV